MPLFFCFWLAPGRSCLFPREGLVSDKCFQQASHVRTSFTRCAFVLVFFYLSLNTRHTATTDGRFEATTIVHEFIKDSLESPLGLPKRAVLLGFFVWVITNSGLGGGCYKRAWLPSIYPKLIFISMSPQGAVLSHKQKSTGQSKCATLLRCFAALICAACVCRGVVEVVALLSFIQQGSCCSSAVWAIVDQVAAAIKDKPGPATRRHQLT